MSTFFHEKIEKSMGLGVMIREKTSDFLIEEEFLNSFLGEEEVVGGVREEGGRGEVRVKS